MESIPRDPEIFGNMCLNQQPLDSLKENVNKLIDKIELSFEEISKDFVCQLCLGISYNPVKCLQCGVIACKDDTQKWVLEQRKGNCFNCRAEKV